MGDEGLDLLADHLGAFGRADPAALGCGDGGRDRPGDQDLALALVLRGAGDPDPGPVDLLDLVREAVVAEPEPVRAEGVGLDDVCARRQVALVDRADQSRVGQVELGQRPVQRGTRRVQHRAHRTVADQDPLARDERGHGSSPRASRISSATWAMSRSV
jgi:hypothetical protein